ncbi:IS200/IS605 family transposase [Patescibacteria group bacterium]|nr:IS200/IS605 family transposase [Patescibacteria group bacterium]
MKEDKHIYKSHNKTALLYHIVCPVKYRRKTITDEVATTIKNVCIEISKRYEIYFVEIGIDDNHVHFLVQSVPIISPKAIVQIIKSITAREIFKNHPEVKKFLWGGKFWTSGYYINTVGLYANEEVIKSYVKNQGKDYKQTYFSQPTLFDGIR